MSQREPRADAVPKQSVFIPSRKPDDVDTNDPAQFNTYAATFTLPGADRGLFARHLIGPDSPINDREYLGEYMGGENLTTDDLLRYMFDPGRWRKCSHLKASLGMDWTSRRTSVPVWLNLATTPVMTTYETASGRYARKGSVSSCG